MLIGDLWDEIQRATARPHGHVKPAPIKNRCGGPGMCRHCLLEELEPIVARLYNDGQTHGVSCHTWGPRHYECALGHIKRLEETISLIDGLEKGRG